MGYARYGLNPERYAGVIRQTTMRECETFTCWNSDYANVETAIQLGKEIIVFLRDPEDLSWQKFKHAKNLKVVPAKTMEDVVEWFERTHPGVPFPEGKPRKKKKKRPVAQESQESVQATEPIQAIAQDVQSFN